MRNPLVVWLGWGVAVPKVIQAGSLMVFSSPQLSDPVRDLLHVGQGLPNLTPSPPSGLDVAHRASTLIGLTSPPFKL